MKLYSAIFLTALLFLGCSSPAKKEHELKCVLHSVIKIDSGNEVVFNKSVAITNGYQYHFIIYDNGTMLVNGKDHYQQEINSTNTYSLLLGKHIVRNMQFQFTKAFDDVVFNLHKVGEQYTYDCETVNDK